MLKREFLFNAAPIISAVFAFLSWSITFLFGKISKADVSMIWMLIILGIIHVIFGFYFGFLVKKLASGNYKDYLTSLPNRKLFYQKLELEIKRLKRNKSPLSLIIIDIDHFKLINDKYGHGVGDKVLVWLAKTIRKYCREIDIPARWGGEEFTIILPETDLNGAIIFAERLRQTIETESQTNLHPVKITISIGVATTASKIDYNGFLLLADKALYKAKLTRNKVEVYDPLDRIPIFQQS